MSTQSKRPERPNLRHLRAFSLAVGERNISRAAEAAHITQSAVSQAVGKLEAYYGCRLLERSAAGVYPTELGRVAVERIDRALARLRAATQRAAAQQRPGAQQRSAAPEAARPETQRPEAARGARTPGPQALDRMLSLSQLAAFLATARGGGFKAGARLLGLSQPSVHRAVRQLQDVLGVELLEHTSLGVAPTRGGADFAAAVALILKEIDLVADDLDEARGRHRGRVAIGSLALGRSELVPRAVARAAKAFPDAQFLIQDGTYDQLLLGLRAGDLDLIVTAGRPLATDDVVEVPLFDDVLAVVARADHPLAVNGVTGLEDLARYPWILPRYGTPTRWRCDELLRKVGAPQSEGLIETGALVSVRALLLESDRLTVLSRRQIAVELESGLLAALDVPLPEPRRAIVATLRRDWKPTQVQAALLQELKAITEEWTAADTALRPSA
ncbi:LysR family transcriptional regulator [Pelagibius sp. 7325]|uniref:LysR family transcriptional regulator n=1 Tax=Pelagibius sp. 7325 TaxID=3131994 RepID=UPI0030EBD31D